MTTIYGDHIFSTIYGDHIFSTHGPAVCYMHHLQSMNISVDTFRKRLKALLFHIGAFAALQLCAIKCHYRLEQVMFQIDT